MMPAPSGFCAMLRYLKYLDFQELSRLLPDYAKSKYRIAQIGASLYLDNLLKLCASERYVIDPYRSGPGGGAKNLSDFPDDLSLWRRAIGVTSGHLPGDFFGLVFSSRC